MPSAGTPAPGVAVDPRDAGPQPYHRLLRNDITPRGYVFLGAMTVLAGWIFASLVILTIQQSIRPDPKGTVSWFGLLATNLSLIVADPVDDAGRDEAEPADARAALVGDRHACAGDRSRCSGRRRYCSSW